MYKKKIRRAGKPDESSRVIYEEIAAIPTVDAHEHLHSEEMRIGRQVDIFLLFHQYLRVDLIGAGMSEASADSIGAADVPLDAKWDAIAPFLDCVRNCSMAEPPFAALQRFFDADDLTKDNYEALSERMRSENKPGLYAKRLREACNIVMVLNQNTTMWQNDLFKPILFEDKFIGAGNAESLWKALSSDGMEPASDLDGYVVQMETLLRRRRSEGMVGVKGYCRVSGSVDKTTAAAAYQSCLAGRQTAADGAALTEYLRHRMYDICGDINLVAVLHSGVWAGNWVDITTIRPTHIYAVACAHRRTRFDLFHAATPQPADAGFLAKSLPNVYLNSCWSHLLSPSLTMQAWDMWLDMLPVNKVIAWGGDYWWAVENVFGVIDRVRRMLATVLARRVASGDFSEARAIEIARHWMGKNALDAYQIEL